MLEKADSSYTPRIAGETWVIEESGTSEDLYHVAYVEGFGIVVLGGHGTILKRKIEVQSEI